MTPGLFRFWSTVTMRQSGSIAFRKLAHQERKRKKREWRRNQRTKDARGDSRY